VIAMFETLPQLLDQGMSVLLAEQSLTFGMSVARRVYIIRDGRIVLSGAPAELAKDASVVQAYLGH
ncbi:MAG TPA: ABC transporter ATP-binding protein, partial [Alphaproteobacteria bacterium]|nr:ABC transporter ATP-binding protein [Alphaproteobacteria bacterium]